MKRWLVVALLLLCSCDKGRVRALSSDGTREVVMCDGATWLKCVHDACPSGFDVVTEDSDFLVGIAKCKP